jgi:hypothetical protein
MVARSPRANLLLLEDDTAFEVLVSERPLKLRLVTETEERGPMVAVFAAAP